MKWSFSPKRPSDKTRDPVASEFFSQDSIKDAGEALVREGIQNSLDARKDRKGGLARVRIYLSGDQHALKPQRHVEWFASAWPHYLARANGLKNGSISKTSACRFLVFEDFETTGLVGDQRQHEVREGVKNPFFYFFRAEGATEKDKERLGRWGIGKQVFPRSSRAQTFFGYTETPEGGFLMGGCILKHHSVDGRSFKPDGFFGLQVPVDDDHLTIPISDPDTLKSFREDFRLLRQPGEHGLSIVVPWLDEGEDQESPAFDRTGLAMAVATGYFLPIFEGRLEVELEDQNGSIRFSKGNLLQILEGLKLECAGRRDERRLKELRRLSELLAICEDALAGRIVSVSLNACPKAKAEWNDQVMPEDLASRIREELALGKTVKVSATLTVRPKAGDEKQDTFSCYIKKSEEMTERPCFIREDLIISDVHCPRTPNFLSIVRVEAGPLAELLGDSENPAHTEWQKSSRNFKDKYTYGGVTIDFVASFPAAVIRRAHANSRQLDRKLLLDLFSDTGPEDQRQEEEQRRVFPKIKQPPDPKPSIRINRSEDGFNVVSAGTPYPPGTRVTISTAYETSKGNAFKAYRSYDFNLKDSSFDLILQGCTLESREQNKFVIITDAEAFSAKLTGFDINRDLVIKARVSTADGSPTESESDVGEEASAH